MSGICGIFSPRDPTLFAPDQMTAIASTLKRPGVTTRQFVDPAAGIGLALFHTSGFRAPKETEVPHWLEGPQAVLGLAGSLRPDDDPRRQDWQAELVSSECGAEAADFPVGLDGQFSLFLWDWARAVLTLAPDVVGSRQLYVYSEPQTGYFAFASELKALRRLARLPREIDKEALAFYLRLGYVAAPMTVFKDVSKLLTFERAEVDRQGELIRSRYYPPACVRDCRRN